MKKVFAMLLTLFGLTLACTCAEEIHTSGKFCYRICEDGTAEIVEYLYDYTDEDNFLNQELEIPGELDGYTVTRIGDCVFDEGNWSYVRIPDSITEISEIMFKECFYLVDIRVSPEHPTLATINGVLFNKKEKRLLRYPPSSERKSYTIPQGIRSIAPYAFSQARLTEVTIPESVTSIGEYAFNRSLLDNITIPGSVKEIGACAFYKCYGLKKATILAGVESIGDYAFSECIHLATVEIPDSVIEVGNNPFVTCAELNEIQVSATHPNLEMTKGALIDKEEKRLISVIAGKNTTYSIPEGICIIGDSAFKDCELLKKVNIPDSVTIIENYAFYQCGKLEKCNMPKNLICIGDYAFGHTELTSINLPKTLESIGKGVFLRCFGLKKIKIPDHITRIEDEMFRGCGSLKSVEIPNSVTYIGAEAFTDTIIGKINIPDSVTFIGDGAFCRCGNLTSVTIPDSVVEIGENLFPFIDCLSLVSIQVSPDHPILEVKDGAVFEKGGKRLLLYPCEREGTSYSIPQGVCEIGPFAFAGCDKLEHIEIPSSVTRIGEHAFQYCRDLQELNIPNSVTYIGESAFISCDSLLGVDIPNSVRYIGRDAFSDCNSLMEVTIPDSVTRIEEGTFGGCTCLSSVEIPDSVTYIGTRAFCAYREIVKLEINIPDSVTQLMRDVFDDRELLHVNVVNRYAAAYCSEHKYPFSYVETEE